jgi:hypothetical protein
MQHEQQEAAAASAVQPLVSMLLQLISYVSCLLLLTYWLSAFMQSCAV